MFSDKLRFFGCLSENAFILGKLKYDSNEKYFTSLDMPENISQTFLLFGDVDNFFVNCCKKDGIWCDMYFDKSKISDKNAEWIILYEYS